MPSENVARVRVEVPRIVASPWTRIIAGPRRGESYRTVRVGRSSFVHEIAVKLESDKAIVDAELRAKGAILVDVPGGCIFETDDAPAPEKPQRAWRQG